VNSISTAFFYKTISWSSWIFSQRVSHHFDSLANYRLKLALRRPITLWVFGSKIIDFTTNTSTRIKEIDEQNEIDALKKLYGDHVIARWLETETQDVRLYQKNLARLEIAQDGCCAGMSWDFISHYWKEIEKGNAPIDAVKAIAHRYREGAPDEAQLAQIFYTALSVLHDWDKIYVDQYNILKTKLNKDIIEKVETYLRRNFTDSSEATHARLAIEKLKLFNDLFQRINREDFFRELEIAAKKMGLSSQLVGHYMLEDTEKMAPNFQQSIDQLPLGIYEVSLRPVYRHDDHIQENVLPGHSIVFIKTEDTCFIFDPNFATLVLSKEESAEILWRIGNFYYERTEMNFKLMHPKQ